MAEKYGEHWVCEVGGVAIRVNGENDEETEARIEVARKKARRTFGEKFDEMLHYYAVEVHGLKLDKSGFIAFGETISADEFIGFVSWCRKFASWVK